MQSTYALRTIIALSPSGSFAAVAYIVPESPTEFLHFVIFLSLPRGSCGWETSACFSAKSDQLRPYAYIRVRIPWLPPRLPLETVLIAIRAIIIFLEIASLAIVFFLNCVNQKHYARTTIIYH